MIDIRKTLLGIFSLAACSDPRSDVARAVDPAPADASPALIAAHEAYLAGDFVAMGERLKDVVADPQVGELAKDNAFALLESAFDATHGHLPARDALPASVNTIIFGVLNGSNPWGPHRMVYLDVRVADGRASHVTDVRLTRLPNETILALGARGLRRSKHDVKGFEDVVLEARELETLPDRGAFAIHVAFDDLPPIDTFIVASKLVASTQPELMSPGIGEASPGNLEIAWRPFRSPELAQWEARSLWIGISRKDDSVWNFYKWDPGELASVRAENLAPDSYWVSLGCTEERTFGGVRISRLAETGRPFTVVR